MLCFFVTAVTGGAIFHSASGVVLFRGGRRHRKTLASVGPCSVLQVSAQASVDHESLVVDHLEKDARIRESTSYVRIDDGLEPWTEALAQALDDTSRGHFLGLNAPPFHVPRLQGQDDVPYKSYYDYSTDTYRGGRFLSYLSHKPLRQGQYDSVPCGNDVEKDIVPQGAWDGNSIAHTLIEVDLADFPSSQPRGAHPDRSPAQNISHSSKDLVVIFNFVEAGYWGHMMDNGLPRVAFAADAARRAGYNLYVLIPQRFVVHGWSSLRQVKEAVEQIFDGKLVVPGQSHDQLPAHCLDNTTDQNAVCRFMFTCGLPSYHLLARRRFHQLALEALHRHQKSALKRTTELSLNAHPHLGLYFERGKDAHNDKGDAFTTTLARKLEATGRWDSISNMSAWPLLDFAAFVNRHKHLMLVEGSAGYHMIWLQTGGTDSSTYTDIMPAGRLAFWGWLWAHVLGLDYKLMFFQSGDSDPEPFFNAAVNLTGSSDLGRLPGARST